MKNIRDLKIAFISMMFKLTGLLYFTKFWWSYALVFSPILLSPVALSSKGNGANGEEMECAYVMMIIAVHWAARALPLEVIFFIILEQSSND